MHCRSPVTDDFVMDNTTVSWRTKKYKPYRETLLLDMEKARLPDTQQYAAAVANARVLLNDMKNEMKRIQIENKPGMKKEMRAIKDNSRTLERIIYSYGLYNSTVGVIQPTKRQMVKACPADTCRGFLNEEFECPMCSTKVCKKCHEQLAEAHQCNPDVVASVKALAAEARPCPTCAASISKIDGCDQMWCTQCKTTFSWRTGRKEEGHTHNPHYYEYMRRNGGVLPRAPGDVPGRPVCGMPDLQTLMQRFQLDQNSIAEYRTLKRKWDLYLSREYHKEKGMTWPPHYLNGTDCSVMEPWAKPADLKAPLENKLAYVVAITNYHNNSLHMNNVGRNINTTQPDNHKVRVKFLLGDIDEKQMSWELQKIDKAYRKNIAKRQVFDMVYQASSDIFQNFVNSTEHPHSTYIQLVELFTYANECISKIEKAYTCVINHYITNPFWVSSLV